MKLLIKLDTKATNTQRNRIVNALTNLKRRYEGITELEWEFESQDYTNAKWVNYTPRSKGLDWGFAFSINAQAWREHGYSYDHVVNMITDQNWGAPGIGGWHLGIWSRLSLEVCKISDSDFWLRAIIDMETMHSFDAFADLWLDDVDLNRYIVGEVDTQGNWIKDRLWINGEPIVELAPHQGNTTGKFLDFDKDVNHGEHPNFGQLATQQWQKNATSTDYYTNYDSDFDKIRRILRTEIRDIYQTRRDEEQKVEELKSEVRRLQLQIIALLQAKIKELLGKRDPHAFYGKEELLKVVKHKH